MVWDEWEQLKAEAAAESSTRMSLNQSVTDSGDGSPGGASSADVKSHKKVWVAAGEGLKRLDEPIGKALTQLRERQTGLEAAGVQSAVAQGELYDSWKKYVKDVSERCGDLAVLLETAGHTLSKSDEQLKDELDRIKNEYRDTAAVGGQKTGK
ncbi:hypothetical protein [Streptomyces sp. NPDC058155]|uniref:hypothetical protein n=1 Tax=Streptomyces sp. NPDC058155 TaxID=3346359 RepID=UPI0036E31D0A